VSITLHENEILGLIGPNGSGKSTFVNAVSGVVPATGRLQIRGRDVSLGNASAVRRAGVLRTYQTPQTYLHLSCIENVLLTTTDRKFTGILSSIVLRPVMLKRERERWRHAAAALDRVGLLDRAEESAANLSYGQQRLLELARTLAGNPTVVMLDEPSAGLNAAETEILAGHLRRMRADGISLLVIDHKIDFITSLVDRVVVLELGNLVAEGDPQSIWQDHRVQNAYLGVADDEVVG
jgi:ABC-type branched-subunit amino acid transport system ATPase component